MTQEFNHISPSERISDSLNKLKNRDLTSATHFAGTVFPEDLTEDMVGVWFDHTQLKTVFRLESVNPTVVWKELFNYTSRVPTKKEIDEQYQPLNSNLTSFSSLESKELTIPYFLTQTVMANAPVTQYSLRFLSKQNSEEVVEELGLGELAKQDTIKGSQIEDGTLSIDKLNFNVSSAGYDTGDFIETVSKKNLSDGWIQMLDGTIGDSQSGASDCADDVCENLFKKLWNNMNLKVYDSTGIEVVRGEDANEDWSAHRRLELPKVLGRMIIGTNVSSEVAQQSEIRIAPSEDEETSDSFKFTAVRMYIRL